MWSSPPRSRKSAEAWCFPSPLEMNPHSSLIKTHIRPGVNTSATAGIQSIYGGTLDTYTQACNLFQLLVFLVLTDNVLHDLISDYSKSYRTERQRGTIMLLPGILHLIIQKGVCHKLFSLSSQTQVLTCCHTLGILDNWCI